jgi:hypothetical protein
VSSAPWARTVVWRHPCDCPTASRPLEPGEEPEHRFDVDGEPFPWHIAEGGAKFAKLGLLYLVAVTMFPLKSTNNEALDLVLAFLPQRPAFVDVAGDRVEFPWALFGSINVHLDGDAGFPIIDLVFIAEELDADTEVPDITPIESGEVVFP